MGYFLAKIFFNNDIKKKCGAGIYFFDSYNKHIAKFKTKEDKQHRIVRNGEKYYYVLRDKYEVRLKHLAAFISFVWLEVSVIDWEYNYKVRYKFKDAGTSFTK